MRPFWPRFWYVVSVAGAVATLVTTVPDALDRIADVGGAILGLLLIGAAIGAGALGFIAGAAAVLYWIRGRRERGEQFASKPREQPALPPSNLPVLYEAPSQKPRWSTAIAIALIAAALLGLAGWFLVRESRLCLGDGCAPQPTPRVTEIVVTATPDPDTSEDPEASPSGEDAADAVLTPEQAEVVTLDEEEVASVLEVTTGGEESRTALFHPLGFELCPGVTVATSDIGNDYSRQITIYRGLADEAAASWVVSFAADGASEIMSELRSAVETCDIRIRPQAVVYGDEVVRLSIQDEDGDGLEVIFFRYKNVLVEVASVSNAGDNANRVEKLAEHAERSLVQVLSRS